MASEALNQNDAGISKRLELINSVLKGAFGVEVRWNRQSSDGELKLTTASRVKLHQLRMKRTSLSLTTTSSTR